MSVARAVSAAIAISAVLAQGCAGRCRVIDADRAGLTAAPPPAELATTPHARIQLPFAVANRLIADALREPVEIPVPVPVPRIGGLENIVGELRAVPRAVVLGPSAKPGHLHVDAEVELADPRGPLFAVRARGDIAPVIERTEDDRLAIGIDPAQLDRLKPEVGKRIAEPLAELLIARLPDGGRRVPRYLVVKATEVLVEHAVDYTYRALRATILPKLREQTRVVLDLPDAPIARVEVSTSSDAMALDVLTTLPVREGLGAPPPAPPADAIGIQLAGATAAAGANWAIATGVAPPRYTRRLRPAADGAYVPHFEWRPRDAARPLAVHMFRVEGGCGHFIVGVRPQVEVRDGAVRAWVDNRRLEHADGPFVLELATRIKALVERSTSSRKRGPGELRVTAGGREVTARLIAAEVAGNELHLQLGLALATAPATTAAASR